MQVTSTTTGTIFRKTTVTITDTYKGSELTATVEAVTAKQALDEALKVIITAQNHIDDENEIMSRVNGTN